MTTKDTLWEQTLKDLQHDIPKATFMTVLKNTELVSLTDSVATIAAPSMIVIGLLQNRFAEQIKQSLQRHGGEVSLLQFVPQSHRAKEATPTEPLFASSEPVKPMVGHLPRVRSDYTFEAFAVSGSNQLAFVSATTIADKPGQIYNPFFIYGPVGVGKTHLMHAIANTVYQQAPESKIIYITSEEFTNDVVDAIRTNDTSRMKKRFRSARLLLIDDIQFIEGKERVQEELFHTFNTLIDNGSQICLSSDRPPHEIKRLEKRLSSRFAGGLTVDIGKPDLELKTAILGIKAMKLGTELPSDVALFLAEQVEDTRSLEGLLLRVITFAKTTTEHITLDLAKNAVGETEAKPHARLHVDDVIKSVCLFYDIKPTALRGPKRDASLVRARQVCMYLLKTKLRLTLVEIGNYLGGRDHTTIMHGVDKITLLVDNKAQVSEDIKGITHSLQG